MARRKQNIELDNIGTAAIDRSREMVGMDNNVVTTLGKRALTSVVDPTTFDRRFDNYPGNSGQIRASVGLANTVPETVRNEIGRTKSANMLEVIKQSAEERAIRLAEQSKAHADKTTQDLLDLLK